MKELTAEELAICGQVLTEKRVKNFWGKVVKGAAEDCWPWVGAVDHAGYGNFRVGIKTIKAQRVSFAIANNKEPNGFVAHRCDNPPCVNPRHLFVTDTQGNMSDMQRKCRRVTNKKATKYKGVFYVKEDKKWMARYSRKGKRVFIGKFKSEHEAAKKYDEAVIREFGNEASIKMLNFPELLTDEQRLVLELRTKS